MIGALGNIIYAVSSNLIFINFIVGSNDQLFEPYPWNQRIFTLEFFLFPIVIKSSLFKFIISLVAIQYYDYNVSYVREN